MTQDNQNKNSIIQVLKTGTTEEKSTFLENIRQTPTPDITLVGPLVDCLEVEKSRAIKERILLILTRLVPLSAFQEVDRMLRSPDPFVRNGIVEIIKSSGIPLIHFLEKLAADDDKDVRKFVIDSLSQEKSESAIKIIRARLDDKETNILYTAIEYLGNFKDSPSVPKIEAAVLNADNFMITCAGLEALAKIQNSPQKDRILEKYMKEDTESIIAFPLLKYLGAFGDQSAFSFIQRLLEKNSQVYTKEIVDALGSMIKRLPGLTIPEPIREILEALQESIDNTIDKYALGKLLADATGRNTEASTDRQIEKARKMLTDDSEMVKLCAVEILADIGETPDMQTLEDIAAQSESDELLEAIGDAVQKIAERTSL